MSGPSELHHEVLVGLAQSEAWVRGDLEGILRQVTERAARAMGIERVNVWLFDRERSRMRCIEHFELSSGEHSQGGVELAAADYPEYFRALAKERAIVANDARTDPRTREFADGYLDVHGITSMLDAPLRSTADVVGIICHEHVGPARIWTPEEVRLAGSLADLASLALATAEREQAEGALKRSEELTREIIAHSLDAIIIADRDGVILDWNPRAETVFGWKRGEALGSTLYETVIPERHHAPYRDGIQAYLETGKGPIVGERIELHARRRSGEEFPIELAVSAVRLDDQVAFSAFVRDITSRVRAEDELRKLTSELEDRVRRRTEQLRAAVEEKEGLLDELEASSLELVARLRDLEQKSERIQSDLERAQVIQRALLPTNPPLLAGVQIDALYRPGTNVGGDLYDIRPFEDGVIAITLADAAGHGVAAAMLSVLFKQRLRLLDDSGAPMAPAVVLGRVNATLAEDFLDQGLFLTAAYGLFDPRTGTLRLASAGHTPILLRRADGRCSLIDRTGPGLGLDAEATYGEQRLILERGDRLLLYTDGLTEGFQAQEPDELIELLEPTLTGASRTTAERLRGLFARVEELARATCREGGRDDVTLLVLEHGDGLSTFDNEPEASEPPPRRVDSRDPTPEATADATLWTAEGPRATHVAVRGRGDWTDCESFRQLARSAEEGDRALVVDLQDCSYLDSAFLGTLHEVVAGSGKAGAARDVSVRAPCEAVRGLFEELGLERVLAAVDPQAAEPPCKPRPVVQSTSTEESQRRLLRAHEILSALSDENRARFADVVRALRAELEPE